MHNKFVAKLENKLVSPSLIILLGRDSIIIIIILIKVVIYLRDQGCEYFYLEVEKSYVIVLCHFFRIVEFDLSLHWNCSIGENGRSFNSLWKLNMAFKLSFELVDVAVWWLN